MLLRIAVGGAAVVGGIAFLIERATPTLGALIVGIVAIVCGLLLLIGLLTPGVAVIVVLGSAGVTLPRCPALTSGLLDAKPSTLFLIVMAVAILLLGPGAFSMDSYLFGRREIVIPHDPRRA